MNNNKIKNISINEIYDLYNQNESEIEESLKLTQEASIKVTEPKNFDLINFLRETVQVRPRIDGMIIPTPNGNTINCPGSNSFFRGENQIFPNSIPTFFRKLNEAVSNDQKKFKAYHLVNQLRIIEFSKLLMEFPLVQQWNSLTGGEVFFEALAQHYGLETKLLDITDDFKVALFFACCGWDENKKSFFPLTKKETEKTNESKYGVIYHKFKRSYYNDFIIIGDNELMEGAIRVGYQPFYRCRLQNAYTIKMTNRFSLIDDYQFTKLIFPHNEDLSNWIFQLMDKGNKIFCLEGLNKIFPQINSIKSLQSFSKDSLEVLLKKEQNFQNIDEIIRFLRKNYNNEITCNDRSKIKLSRQLIRLVEKKYEKEIKKDKFLIPKRIYFQ